MNIQLYKLIHNECTWKRYYNQPIPNDTWLRRNITFPLKQSIKRWLFTLHFPFNSKYNTQQYPGERKSKYRMLLENIVWTAKYKETNKYYFLYGLDLKSRSTKDYVAYTEFRVLRNIINFRYREILPTAYSFNYLALVRDKFLFYQYCKSLNMPYPKTIALISNNEIAWQNNGENSLNYHHLTDITHHDFDGFCKAVSGEFGKDAFALRSTDGNLYLNNSEISIQGFQKIIANKTFIIQERLRNHPTIDHVYPKSLNTIKLVTFLHDDGEVEFIDSLMRFGANGNIVDNAGQGGIFVGVDRNGKLQDVGYHEPGWKKNLVVNGIHPDTGESFAGLQLPFWNEMYETACRFHKYCYGIPSMNWDIAFTPDGFYFTEAGEDWEIAVYQVTNGGMKDKFYRTHGKALDVKTRNYI